MAPGRRSLGLLTAGLLAGACGGPPEPLAPAPTADEADPRRALRADGPWVIAADGVAVVGGQLVARTADGALVAYAALDGRSVVSALPLDAAPVAWVPVPGGGLAIGSVTTLVRDGTTGARPAWSALTPGGQAAAAGLGGIIVGGSRELVRLDPATGRIRWRVPIDRRPLRAVAVDRATAYAVSTEAIDARDLATGQVRWHLELGTAPTGVAFADGTAIVAYLDRVELIDGASGVVRHSLALASKRPAIVVDHDRAYVLDVDRVQAIDLRVAALAWTAAMTLEPTDAGPLGVRVGDALIVAGTAGRLVALAPATGAAQWTVGVGVVPRRLLASHGAVAALGDGQVGLLALPPTAPPETAVIRGRLACPELAYEVAIDDVVVATDPDGGYQAIVTARGQVYVEAFLDGLGESVGAPVRLDGRRRYRAPALPPGGCPAVF